ncbi:hypothetical protein [Paenibacillus sp. PSB04]|uniref:hypothetical protein n=1 Tax=Paenibacillus sp. PSB04 TaxID=2866810 RepID=UPI0021F0E5F9|nr:hypothetical protein [Paenibacillus sp. PSB04]UYO02545.1 hypothetical protein K2F33_22715 [Paenibacillus sp. PSB04]
MICPAMTIATALPHLAGPARVEAWGRIPGEQARPQRGYDPSGQHQAVRGSESADHVSNGKQ